MREKGEVGFASEGEDFDEDRVLTSLRSNSATLVWRCGGLSGLLSVPVMPRSRHTEHAYPVCNLYEELYRRNKYMVLFIIYFCLFVIPP